MASKVKAVPDGYHTVTPYLFVEGAPKLIEFLSQAFDGKERYRLDTPDGKVSHAEVTIGDSAVMIADAGGEWKPIVSWIHLYVPDTDIVYRRALNAGGTSVREPADQVYGDRSGGVRDPFGNVWWISTHIEDVSLDEVRRRQDAQRKKRA